MKCDKIGVQANKIVFILYFIALFSAITAATSLTPIVKNINSIAMLASVIIFPYISFRKNDFDKVTNSMMVCIIIMTIIQTVRSMLFPDVLIKGNLLFTMFGNEFCMLSMIITMFAYLSCSERTLISLKTFTILFCFLACVYAILSNNKYYFSSWAATAFFAYYNPKQKLVLILMYILILHGAIYAEETSRTNLITFGVSIIAILCHYFNVSKKIIYLLCYGMIIIPIAYFIITLIDPTFSVIKLIMESVSNNVDETMDTTDTRTFLFAELMEDLTENNALLWGKGARSGYFSYYFYISTSGLGDHWYRITSEVSGLHFLLRGGIMFCVFHYGLIVYAVHKALMYGRNKFVQTIAILASGWIFISCFSFLHGFSIVIVGFYILLGCCLSEKWLNKTDKEIEKLFI